MSAMIHEIRIPFRLPLDRTRSVERFVNAWLVGESCGCLVDTGPAGNTARVAAALAEKGKTLKDIRRVINTHEHADHVGGNHAIRAAAAAGAEFMCHAEAVSWIEDLDLQGRLRPIFAFNELAGQSIRIDRKLREGDIVDLEDGTTLAVISTPGHSPGSMALYCPQDQALITADTLQPVARLPLYSNLAQTRASLQRLIEVPGVKKMYASHAERPYEGAQIMEALQQSLAYLERVDTLVREATADLPEPRTPESITFQVLSRLGLDPPPVMPITVQSIMAHLR